jgi:hypothetical protein
MKLSSRRTFAVGAVIGSIVVAGLVSTTPAIASVPAVVSGDSFSAVAPTRILDTRTGLGVPGSVAAPIGAASTVTLHVAGKAGVPDPVDAVVLNVTAVAPTKATFVSVYPGDLSSPPAVSNINLPAGAVVPNLVTVKVDAAGDVKLYNSAGSVHLLADVTGYYDSSATDTFTPMAPLRLLDTRDGTGLTTGPSPVGAGATIDVKVASSFTIPANADAVVLNVTAVGATANTYVQVYPKPATTTPPPTVSNLNVKPHTAVANLVTVGIGDAGDIRLRNANGSVELIADVAGYFSTDASGSLFTPITPTRILDSRTGSTFGPGGAEDLLIGDGSPVPATATAALFNLTAVAPSLPSYLQAYPTPASGHVFPGVSNLNVAAGETRANLVSSMIGAGADVRVRNQAGKTGVLVDLSGYYTSTAGVDHGTAPTDGPPRVGVSIAASLNSVHPGQFGHVIVTYTTNVDTNPFSLAANFRAGVTKIPNLTTVAGVPGSTSIGVQAAPIGVVVPIVLTAVSADLGATAQSVLTFVPVPLSCHAAAVPANPAQHGNVDIVVGTQPGANITAVFHGNISTFTQKSKADILGRGDVVRNIGGAKVGFRVIVTVTVSLGTNTATCSTAYTPIA